jgi:hypothetical protein
VSAAEHVPLRARPCVLDGRRRARSGGGRGGRGHLAPREDFASEGGRPEAGQALPAVGKINNANVDAKVCDCIVLCLSENPASRPDARTVRQSLVA